MIDVNYYVEKYGANWREDAPRVYAFQPRSGKKYCVAESNEDLENVAGSHLFAAQCDSCGNSCYQITRKDNGQFVAVCITNPDGIQPEEFRGCGLEYPIHLHPEYEVIF